MKKTPNKLIAFITILFVLACGTAPPSSPPQPSFGDQVSTVVAATVQSLSISTPADTPNIAPIIIPTENSTNLPPDTLTVTSTYTFTSTPSNTPTITPTPTIAPIVVMDITYLTPLPTPSPIPGQIPSGGYIYIEHVEMISCNDRRRCSQLFSPNDPNYRWTFPPPADICLLWVEDGYRDPGPGLSIELYQHSQLLSSQSSDVIGDRICRMADMPVVAAGDYQTKLVFGRLEFNLFWSIR